MDDVLEVERERQEVVEEVEKVMLEEVKNAMNEGEKMAVSEMEDVVEVERERDEVLKDIEGVVVEELVKDVVKAIEEDNDEKERDEVVKRIARDIEAMELVGDEKIPRTLNIMFPCKMSGSTEMSDLDKLGNFKEEDRQLIWLKRSGDSLEVSLDTSGYRPDEIEVKQLRIVFCFCT